MDNYSRYNVRDTSHEYEDIIKNNERFIDKEDYKNSTFYQHKLFSEYLTRYLGSDGAIKITVYEHAIINFIANRTIDFKKTVERITRKHFMSGVYTREGVLIQQKVAFSESTVKRVLKSLEEKGLLIVDHNPTGNSYSLNFDHEAFQQFFTDTDMIITSKKSKEKNTGFIKTSKKISQNQGWFSENQGLVQTEPTSIYSNQTKKTEQLFHSKAVKETDGNFLILEIEEDRKENLSEIKEIDVASANRKKIEEKIAQFSATFDASQKKRIERIKVKNNLSIASIQAIWQDKMQSTEYANKHTVAQLTTVEMGMIKQGLQHDLKRDFASRSRMDEIPIFFAFCINDWGLIMRAKFGWMTKNAPPHEPDFIFFVKFRKKFFEAYWQEYSLLKYTGGTFRSTLISDLIKKGFSEKEATEEARIQEELEKAKSTLRRKANEAEQAKNDAIRAKHSAMKDAQKEADAYSAYITKKIFNGTEQAFLDKMKAKLVERPNQSPSEVDREMRELLREMLGDDYVE